MGFVSGAAELVMVKSRGFSLLELICVVVIIGLLAAKVAGITSVSTPHGFGEISDLKLRFYSRLGIFSLKFFDSVVPLSETLVEDVKGYGIKESKSVKMGSNYRNSGSKTIKSRLNQVN